jgi:acyl dehydratase
MCQTFIVASALELAIVASPPPTESIATAIGLMMRLFIDNCLSAVASLGSPSVDEIRWLRPVRPNDQLRLRLLVLDTNPSRSKPDRGIVVRSKRSINVTSPWRASKQ